MAHSSSSFFVGVLCLRGFRDGEGVFTFEFSVFFLYLTFFDFDCTF